MPKVTEEYTKQKKAAILAAARRVYDTKALYQITMRDIIKEAGCSQGGIYRYYSDLDELLIEMIDSCNPNGNYKESIESIIRESNSPEQAMDELFDFLGSYMLNSPKIFGKILYELTVIMSIQPERGRRIQAGIKDGQSGHYFIKQMNELIREGVTSGFFHPKVSMEQVMSFISIAIDGITMDGCLLTCYNVPQIGEIPFDIGKLMNTLKTAVQLMLSPNEGSVEEKR